MSEFERIEKYSPTNDFYNLSDKLFIHVMKRSEEAFERADRIRNRVKTPEQFEKYRTKAKKTFLDSLGDIPYDKELPLNAKVTQTVEDEGIIIECLIFEAREGVYIPANMYIPRKRNGKIPAVLFQGGHNHLGRMCEQYQKVCRTIAKCGIAVLAIDHIAQGERLGYPELFPFGSSPCFEHEWVGRQCLMAGGSVLKYFVADARRAIDYICTRPEIDSSKIGATGSSGGGTMTAVIAICDDRIKAVAPGTFITSRREYFYAGSSQDAEQIWSGVTDKGFDHFELISAVCPTPYLILGVRSDFFCPEGTLRVYEKEKEFYKMLGCEDSLRIEWDDSKHAYTERLAVKAAEFFAEIFTGKRITAEAGGFFKDLSLLKATETGVADYPVSVFEENRRRFLSQKKLSKKVLRDRIFSNRKPCDFNVRVLYKDTFDGYFACRIMWFTQEYMPCYGIYICREENKEKRLPITVCLWADGTDRLEENRDKIFGLCENGGVLVCDLTGMGKCSPREFIDCTRDVGFGAEVKMNKDLIFLGDSLPTMRIYDLIKTFEMLDIENVKLYTKGNFSVFRDVLKTLGINVSCECENPVSVMDIITTRLYDDTDITNVIMPDIGLLLEN